MRSKLINHHIHTTGSDGGLSPTKVVELAKESGLSFICFTDHYPRGAHFLPWGEGEFFTQEYVGEVKRNKRQQNGELDISFGVEVDWYEGGEEYLRAELEKREYDYVLGAVHGIRDPTGKAFRVNYDKREFQKSISAFDSFQTLIKEYYKQVRLMTKSRLFDAVAHLDVIKTFNKKSKFFSQEEPRYQQEVLSALDTLAESGMTMEINTSGWRYDCKEQFPSYWILEQARQRDIPITIGSDMHFPEWMTGGLEAAKNLARQAGYDHIVKYKNRQPVKVSI